MTTYCFLTKQVIGPEANVSIRPDEFVSISDARDSLLELLAAEEKFHLVVSNHRELEAEASPRSIGEFIAKPAPFQWSQEERTLFNRRLTNLLSAAKGYVDHLQHAAPLLLGRSTLQADRCLKELSVQYDNSFGYRVMEALRNYSQHRGLPIHSLQYAFDRGSARAAAALCLHPDHVRADGKFKASVLNELEAAGDKIDLMPLAREYVSGLSRVHSILKTELKHQSASWERVLDEAIMKYKAAFPQSSETVGLAAVEVTDGVEGRTVQVFPEFLAYVRHMDRANDV